MDEIDIEEVRAEQVMLADYVAGRLDDGADFETLAYAVNRFKMVPVAPDQTHMQGEGVN